MVRSPRISHTCCSNTCKAKRFRDERTKIHHRYGPGHSSGRLAGDSDNRTPHSAQGYPNEGLTGFSIQQFLVGLFRHFGLKMRCDRASILAMTTNMPWVFCPITPCRSSRPEAARRRHSENASICLPKVRSVLRVHYVHHLASAMVLVYAAQQATKWSSREMSGLTGGSQSSPKGQQQ